METSAFDPPAIFVAAAVVLTALALAFVLAPLWRTRARPRNPESALLVSALREHARELDAELAAGRLDAATHAAARADLERRLLQEAAPRPGCSERRAPRAVALALALVVPVAAAVLYARLGDPEALGRRETAPPASAPGVAGIADLRAHVERHPGDGRGWVLLARAEAAQDNFAVAAQAYERALALPKVARDAGIWCEYADAFGMAQGGLLAGRPAELIAKALALNPKHHQALEMAGSAAYEARDFVQAALHWRALQAQLDPASGEARELSAALARAERLARTALPPPLSAAAMERAP